MFFRDDELKEYLGKAAALSPDHPVVISKFIMQAKVCDFTDKILPPTHFLKTLCFINLVILTLFTYNKMAKPYKTCASIEKVLTCVT